MSAAVSQTSFSKNTGIPMTPGKVRIVSIFPIERRQTEALGRGFTHFILEPAERGKWTYCEVEDDVVWQRDMTSVNEEQPSPGMISIYQPAHLTASSLVSVWTGHMVGKVGKPGIAILPDSETEPSDDPPGWKPSEKFLKELEARQTEYANWHVNTASDLHTKGESRSITDSYRKLAFWLYGTGANTMPWYPKATFKPLKRCVGCGEDILIDATRCRHCSLDLVDWYFKYNLEPEGDDAVARVLQSLRDKPRRGRPPNSTLADADSSDESRPKTYGEMTKAERKEYIHEKLDEKDKG